MKTEANGQASLLSVCQVAAMMQISKRTVWRLLSSGELIAPIRIGGNTRWSRNDLENWIAEGCPPVAASQQ